jgi:hypothetical protein
MWLCKYYRPGGWRMISWLIPDLLFDI